MRSALTNAPAQVPTRANGQPAFGAYLRAPAGISHGIGLYVLTLGRRPVCAMTRFDNSVFPWFGLPRSLPSRSLRFLAVDVRQALGPGAAQASGRLRGSPWQRLNLPAGAARARVVAPYVPEFAAHGRARAGLHVGPAVDGRPLVLQPLPQALAEPSRDRRILAAAGRTLAAGGRVLGTGRAAGPPGVGAAAGPAVPPGWLALAAADAAVPPGCRGPALSAGVRPAQARQARAPRAAEP